MRYEIHQASVSLGGVRILDHVDLTVKGKEKLALTGANGAGKTTLLRLIAGELEPDADDKTPAEIIASRSLTIGMLSQLAQPAELDCTVRELAERSANAEYPDSFTAEFDRLFTGFGLHKEDREKKLREFSGGEQTKILFIRLLLAKPDILLLDEPTNHLDTDTVEWLEGYLQSYPHAVIMVSHDRYFLDRTAEAVLDLERGRLTRYPGNYSEFRREKDRRIRAQQKEYERQQEEIKRLEELIERFKRRPNKAAFARTRKQILDRMERVGKPEISGRIPVFSPFTPDNPGSRQVFDAQKAQIGYDRPLFTLTFRLNRGAKLAVLGKNGSGKTALLKTFAGLLPLKGGRLHTGKGVNIGYFDQHTADALGNVSQSVAEYFREHFPALPEKEMRSCLGRFLFGGREAAKPLSGLSGGERTRLALAVMLNERPNLLILDEPTNHCDIRTKEVLEAAFKAFEGTIIFASHDRYFVRELADAILFLGEGSPAYYPFGYEHYQEQRRKNQLPKARISAEEEALVASLRAVPRGRAFIGGSPSDEALYADWRMRPVLEELEAAENAYADLSARLQEEKDRLANDEEYWDTDSRREVQDDYSLKRDEEIGQLERLTELASECYTKACMDWDEARLDRTDQSDDWQKE